MTQIDHVFVFPRDPAALQRRLDMEGLVPSFRRDHPGQGTANVCYCFENTYLELLRVEDATAEQHPHVARTALIRRGSGDASVCPIGIAWRNEADGTMDVDTWHYEPPFLPAGASIAVATESDDPTAPFVFRSPGDRPPSEWTDGRAGALQRNAGLGRVERIILRHPPGYRPGPAIAELVRHTMLSVETAPRWSLSLEITRLSGGQPMHLDDIC